MYTPSHIPKTEINAENKTTIDFGDDPQKGEKYFCKGSKLCWWQFAYLQN